jgi:hypothetical protein
MGQWSMRRSGAILAFGMVTACSSGSPSNTVTPVDQQVAKAATENCASPKIIAVIRDKIFDAAIEQAKTGTQNLNNLRSSVIGRIEAPLLQGSDPTLQRAQCSGRVVFPLPPTVQKAFGDNNELATDITYTVQPAADKSGLVVEAVGTEPIVQMLVDASQKKRIVKVQLPYPGSTSTSTAPLPRISSNPDVMAGTPRLPEPAFESLPSPSDVSVGKPSFSCKGTLNRVERVICNDVYLADQDRALASSYRAAKQRATAGNIAKLEATNAKFRAQRNACSDASCIAGTYDIWTITLENWNGEAPE